MVISNLSQEPQRGKIRNEERARQLRDFSGLRWFRITPSDIDLTTDFDCTSFVWGETKLEGTELPDGQRMMLKNHVVNSLNPAIAIVTEHTVHDTSVTIPMAETIVTEYYTNVNSGNFTPGKWVKTRKEITAKKFIDIFLHHTNVLINKVCKHCEKTTEQMVRTNGIGRYYLCLECENGGDPVKFKDLHREFRNNGQP